MITLTPTFRYSAVAACLLAFFVGAQSARADVTAVVNNGTLEISRALGPTNWATIRLSNRLSNDNVEEIGVHVDGTLLRSFSQADISKIDIFAELTTVSLEFFEFEGNVTVFCLTRGACWIGGLDLSGDLRLYSPAGGFSVWYDYFRTEIDGDLTVDGALNGDGLASLWITGDLNVSVPPGGAFSQMTRVTVEGDLNLAGSPSNEFVELANVLVKGDARISLGQSTSGDKSDFDADWCWIVSSTFEGNLLIEGQQGDDTINVRRSTVKGNLNVTMGPGADFLNVIGLTFGTDSQIFLGGGKGNSDELVLNGLILDDEEHAGFEAITP